MMARVDRRHNRHDIVSILEILMQQPTRKDASFHIDNLSTDTDLEKKKIL